MTDESNKAMTLTSDSQLQPPSIQSVAESNMVAAESITAQTSTDTGDTGNMTGYKTPDQTNQTDPPGGPAPYSPMDMTNHHMNMTHQMLQQLTQMMTQMAMQNQATQLTTNANADSDIDALNDKITTLTNQMTNLTTTDNASSTSNYNAIDNLTENQVYKTVNQRLGKTKFGGAMPGNGTKGPILFQWEMDMLSILKVLNLYPAISGEDYSDRAQALSAYAIIQGLTEDMQTRISAQPKLTICGLDLWKYLQSTYAPRGVTGMIFGLTSLKEAKPAKPLTPETVRKYFDELRVLWLFNERQICPIVSWGCKLEMLFRALDAPWASQFKFHLTRRLQDEIAVMDIDDGPDAEDGEALIVSTIADITEFLATVDVGSSPVAELHYTQTGGKGGKGGKSKGGKGGKGNRRMLDFERNRIRDYYANESDADRRQRQASRAKDTCATCGQLGHWRMDPECKGARDEGEAHVTEVGTDSD